MWEKWSTEGRKWNIYSPRPTATDYREYGIRLNSSPRAFRRGNVTGIFLMFMPDGIFVIPRAALLGFEILYSMFWNQCTFFFLSNVDLQSNRSRNHLKLSRSHGAPLKSRKHEKHAVLVNTAPSSVHALDSYSYTFIHFADAFYPKQFTTYNPSLELLMESIKFTSNDFFIDVQVLSKDLVPRALPEGWFGFEINFYPVFTANSNPKADFHHFGKRKVSMCVAQDT